jgi:hypothetical protein
VIVVEVVAIVLLIAFGASAFSVVAWVLFQAAVKLWDGTRRRRVERTSSEALHKAASYKAALPRAGEVILREWYANGLITPTELELIAEFVVWQGRPLPTTPAAATAMLWEDFERRLEPTPEEGAAAVPDLPPGYFDGRVTNVEPENKAGWVEWSRPGRESIWMRRSE